MGSVDGLVRGIIVSFRREMVYGNSLETVTDFECVEET